ncbi:heme ABC exporter ATP-binding protein CcmA [Aureimonas glaciei]|uniref:Cytochrome c biogenesis ATP-binding export protein CcmA n=1 Tax=Aureimonas glaciei TaxID=1776957 RepID=A0A917DJU5_9HYPH|nr:heme ABC exporter ATP-binding protein CcmA [Aureimonas glaciei]GGD42037.1 cytochrome c biogenesis ATP-binding export protein CcmA [Aureimonas glaciei]
MRELCASRGGSVIAGPLDFALSGGEALVVTGENGAGKSTLLRTLAGLLPPGGGALEIEGFLAADGEPARHLGDIAHYLGHRQAMKPAESVGGGLGFWRDFFGTPGLAIEAALAAVGLPGVAGLPFGYLSAGQQRRAAIARLLVAQRSVWILDEPTAALDQGSQAMFARLLAAHLETGGIVVAATHQPLGLAARELRLERRGDASSPQGALSLDAADRLAAEGWL